MIRNKLKTVSLALLCFTLIACNSENDAKTEITQSSNKNHSTDKSIEKTTNNNSGENFVVEITNIKQSYSAPQQKDPTCVVDIELTNNTGKEVSLFQLSKFSIDTEMSKYSDHGSTFRVKNGESTTRAGIQFPHSLCDTISEINIDEFQCLFKGFGNHGTQGYSCKDKVIFKGKNGIKFISQ